MVSTGIPRWRQRGIFSIRAWWPLLLPWAAAAQSVPQLALHRPVVSAPAAHRAAQEQLTILALRVAFTLDSNLSTTGTGKFLEELDTLRCPVPAFLVDPTPHDAAYFYAQLEAVANYYDQVSRGQAGIDLEGSLVFPPEGQDPLVVGLMASYRPVVDDDSSDALLVRLYAESLRAAQEVGANVWDYDVVVVFHAGLGQDFNYPTLDPTPLDIPSANIDLAMIEAALGTRGIPLPPETALFETPGILLPEGQNHIFYDIVEDIFPGALNFCDLQTGLTGTFALLLGFVLGLPPLFDLDDGETGVGVFGLMDVGSNNGLGVVPAPPTAWTRLHMRWETAVELAGAQALPARHLVDGQVGRVTLSLDEHFLVENRSNWLPGLPGVDLDSLRFRNREPAGAGQGFIVPNYFDYLVDSAGLTVDTATGVITAVPNYDLGLPGSGLLIWHVDESRIPGDLQGLNNDPSSRAVALEEADGAVDIGFPTRAIFADPTLGWRWDLWYAGNPAWFEANPEPFRLAGNPRRLLALDRASRPSSHLNSGAESGIALIGIGPAAHTLEFSVLDETEVTRLPNGSRLLGFNGLDWIYVLEDSVYLGEHGLAEYGDSTHLMISEHDAPHGATHSSFWALDQISTNRYRALQFDERGDSTVVLADAGYVADGYFDDGILWLGLSVPAGEALPPGPDTSYIRTYRQSPDPLLIESYGYLYATDSRTLVLQVAGVDSDLVEHVDWPPTDIVSLGDVDGDGLDEIVAVDPLNSLNVVNARAELALDQPGPSADGFPVSGPFNGPALIANLTDDIRPELVVVLDGDIAVFSPAGQLLMRLGLHADPADLFLMHLSDGRVGLANGDRIHWFHPDDGEQNLQWVTAEGRHSRSRYSLNDGIVKADQPRVLDRALVYNYPNPVTDGRTTIRFYTGTAASATIRIYTVDGLSVIRADLDDLATNDYNEWEWVVGDRPAGLYYAVVEVHGSSRVSALVKIAVVR